MTCLVNAFNRQIEQCGEDFDSSGLVLAGAKILKQEAEKMTEEQQVEGLKLLAEYLHLKHGHGLYAFFLSDYVKERQDAELNSEGVFEKLSMARMICMYELLNSRLALFNNMIQMQ